MSKDSPIDGKPGRRGPHERGRQARPVSLKLPRSRPRVSVHDTLEMEGRVWSVTGVFAGAPGQESVVGLRVEGLRHDATAYGKVVPELFVPEVIVRRGVEAGMIVHHAAAKALEVGSGRTSPPIAERAKRQAAVAGGLEGRMTYEDLQHLEIQRAVDYCRSRYVPEPTPGGPLRLMGDTSRLAATIVLAGTALASLAALASTWF